MGCTVKPLVLYLWKCVCRVVGFLHEECDTVIYENLVSIPPLGTELLGGEGGGLEESMEGLNPFFIPCPVHLFHLTLPELHPFIISW